MGAVTSDIVWKTSITVCIDGYRMAVLEDLDKINHSVFWMLDKAINTANSEEMTVPSRY